jgi:DNA-binding response OmpR family regulator
MSWRTLIVDDEPGYCDLLKRVAENAGFAVTATTDAANALALLHAGKLDLLITDLDMPHWNGFDLAELAGGLPNPPKVLFITAQKNLLEDVPRRLRNCHCLLKPFELSDLRAKLALLTGRWEPLSEGAALQNKIGIRL